MLMRIAFRIEVGTEWLLSVENSNRNYCRVREPCSLCTCWSFDKAQLYIFLNVPSICKQGRRCSISAFLPCFLRGIIRRGEPVSLWFLPFAKAQ